ncbi:14-3-3-like protein [Syncephalis pseudoplumigaleata]|uniref:14-3-3-like protein n=1 Tax=Syncephalis pseudoplumigaleata TaxID=1712513 RepID=A0A4P9Z5M6_9FUNG|nr:14-3-3-like protein [Syncephalis pseudoplumigaleata]|eukprot:RKP26930.1 14-3-3-like protein [Syncephalis pseudoplumigaleata]
MSVERAALVVKAAEARKYGRYEEMFASMVEAIRMDNHVVLEEMKLLSFAYKTLIALRRARWRNLSVSEQRATASGDVERAETIGKDKAQIQNELLKICQEFDGVFGDALLRSVSSDECHMLYYKMRGNYHRFMAEFSLAGTCQASIDAAEQAYAHATKIARGNFPPTHAIRLHVALNYSTFCYEIRSDHDRAFDIAESAVEEAEAMMDKLPQEEYDESIFILKLLKDQLNVWHSTF